jgi:hypothetical protein
MCRKMAAPTDYAKSSTSGGTMRRVIAFLLLLSFRVAFAQSPVDSATQPSEKSAPLLSPQAAFDHASAPVDIIHRDVANWSDVEVNSLTTAIAQAKDACQARSPELYTGSDLVAYARLCSLGKEWQSTYKAATTYINSRDPKPLLDQAYAFEVQAELNLGQPKSAVGACIAMMNSVPYGELTDEVTEAAVRYLQYAYTYDAITLLGARQPYVLHALNPSHPLPPSESAPSQPGANAATPNAASSSIPVHTLFEHALDFAAFEQFDNQPSMAASIVAQLDRNVPADLPSDEAIYIAADRRQYALIGTRFPDLPGALSLLPANETPPAKPKFGSSTVFLLFPPWCAQCVRQAQEITDALVRTAIANGPGVRSDVHIYALLADKPLAPTAKPASRATPAGHRTAAGKATADATDSSDKPETPKTAADQLRKTQTLVVAPSTLTEFNANDFPFLIATDHNGVIRLMVSAAPNNALNQNGPIDQLTDFINARWPPPLSSPHPAPPPPPPPASSNPADFRNKP